MRFTLRHCMLVGAALAALPAHAQVDSRDAMLDGNALFREGLYRAALLRYREAAAMVTPSPLLSYNLGVTYYRLGETDEALSYLESATADPTLAPLAAYNMGSIYRDRGDWSAAIAQFQRAASLAPRRDLRRAAERAAEAIAAGTGPSAPGPARTSSRPAPRRAEPAGGFRVVTLARIGQNDNVYEAPKGPYVDLSDPAQPTVTPVVHAASFMPVDLLAEYVLPNEAGDTDFIFAYRLDGDFYDAEFSNANRVSQRFSIGADIVLAQSDKRKRTLDSAFFLRSHEETNFDPDDGIDRVIDGEDVSGRYRFRSAGAQASYGHAIGTWEWGFDMLFERRQYEDTPLVASYDHDYYATRLRAAHAINDRTRLSLGLRQYRRIYDERLSRDLTGALLSTNPTLKYTYTGLELGLSRELSRSFELGLYYMRIERADGFVGYYDYTQDVLRVRADYRPNGRFDLSAGVIGRTYDYPNAFAFNLPAAGPRELDALGLDLKMEYRVTRAVSVWASIENYDTTSTDPRSEFAQSLSTLGVKWRR